MKKVLFIVIVCLISSIALYAEEVVGIYRMSYFEKSYEIQASKIENGEFSIFIYVQGDNRTTPTFINIESYEVMEFNKSLLQIRDKFIEWRKIAKDNKVTDLNKEINVEIPNVTIGWKSSEWFFSFKNKITAKYVFLNSGKDVVMIAKEAVSSKNEYIKEYFYLVFTEPEEIDNLVSQLDVEKITSKLNKVSNTLDLFK